MERWNVGIMESWSKTHNFSVWIEAFGVNFYSFSINVDIDARDNHPLVAIMAFPNENVHWQRMRFKGLHTSVILVVIEQRQW